MQLRLALATIINDLFAREPQLIATKPLYSYDPAAYAFPEALIPLSTTLTVPSSSPFPVSLHAQTVALSAGVQTDTSRCSRHVRVSCGICPKPVLSTPTAPTTGLMDDTRATSASMPSAARRITVLRSRAGAVAPGTHIVRRQTRDKGRNKSDTGLPSLVFMPVGTTPLVDLLPRFLRLSALAAIELATEEAESAAASIVDTQSAYGGEGATDGILGQGGGGGTGGGGGMLGNIIPWSPTKEWFMLLAGLATRAVIEGYTVGGWQGFQPAQTIFSIGLPRTIGGFDDSTDQPGEFAWFEPDELPGLKEAARTLFPSYEGDSSGIARRIFFEQMQERLRVFMDIPSTTSDFGSHLAQFSARYPAEPVERAAVRFCEAVHRWRGKPELETYKKSGRASMSPSTAAASLSFNAFVHSNPTSPSDPHAVTSTPTLPSTWSATSPQQRGPPIARYFVNTSSSSTISIHRRPRSPLVMASPTWASKRPREVDAGGNSPGKRPRYGWDAMTPGSVQNPFSVNLQAPSSGNIPLTPPTPLVG